MTPRFSPLAFSLAWCIGYVAALAFDAALFRYYPLTGQFTWGRATLADAGPAMVWYGLLASAALVALPVALLVPRATPAGRLRDAAWLVPLAALVACAWLMRPLFAN